jgi:hypothetical protein
MTDHTGTHVDVPFHHDDEGATVDQVPLERFAGPALFIRSSYRAAAALPHGRLPGRPRSEGRGAVPETAARLAVPGGRELRPPLGPSVGALRPAARGIGDLVAERLRRVEDLVAQLLVRRQHHGGAARGEGEQDEDGGLELLARRRELG